jgi:uncharacterized repeat protein (TIGR02543 family)
MMSDGTETVHANRTVTPPVTTVTNFPADPARTGYSFARWNTKPGGGGSEFTASTTVTGDITVYAQWTGETYTVTFNNDGGDTPAAPATKTVTSPNTTIDTLPNPPTKTGYNFGGWYTEPGGGGSEFTASTTVTGDITVYAQWTGETYTVTFKSGYGTDDTLNTKTVAIPATTIDTLPAPPTRTGYNFGGWYTEPGGGGSEFTASNTVSGDIAVYAQWTGETYTVTFKSGYAPETSLYFKTVTYPATIIGPEDFPANPSWSGYGFTGWWYTAGNSPFTATTTVNGDIMVYAQWMPNTYTVTFMRNDGAGTVYTTKPVTTPATTVGTLPGPPTRSGYVFDSWNTQADGLGTSFTSLTTINDDITVYAKWTAITYTVTFMANDGTGTVYTTKPITTPATTIGAEDFPTAPSRTGYGFNGWYTTQSSGGSEFTATTPVTADRTVYARWTTNTYTVTFRNNYAPDVVMYTRTVTYPATTLGYLGASPTRNRYTFDSWNTRADGVGTEFTATTPVTEDVTVYAKWTPITYTVTFMANVGAGTVLYTTRGVTAPATTIGTADFPAAPVRSGYNFNRWWYSVESSPFIATTTVSEDMTVTAQWSTYSYTVTFNSDGGTMVDPKTVVSPATTIDALPSPPTRTGYLFDGWYTQNGGNGTEFTALTTVSASTTVYAKWNSYSYTVTFDSDGGTTVSPKTVASPNTTVVTLPNPPTKTGGYTFSGWYMAQNGGGTPFTAATTVTGNITVYALWAGNYDITLDLGDAGAGAFSQPNFTITKPSGSQTITITGTGYTNPRWYVDDTLKGTATSITINSADYNLGGHNLTLIITQSGVSWSKEITFTVTN